MIARFTRHARARPGHVAVAAPRRDSGRASPTAHHRTKAKCLRVRSASVACPSGPPWGTMRRSGVCPHGPLLLRLAFPEGRFSRLPILSGLISFTVAHASVGIGRRAGISPKPKAGASQSWKSRRLRAGGYTSARMGMTRRLPWNYGQRVRRGVALDDVDVSAERTARPSPGGSPHARSMTQVWCL